MPLTAATALAAAALAAAASTSAVSPYALGAACTVLISLPAGEVVGATGARDDGALTAALSLHAARIGGAPSGGSRVGVWRVGGRLAR